MMKRCIKFVVILFSATFIFSGLTTTAHACKPNAPLCPTFPPVTPKESSISRKVTKINYDQRGNVIQQRIYDDVGPNANLIHQTLSEYDQYNNTIVTRQYSNVYNTETNKNNVGTGGFKTHIPDEDDILDETDDPLAPKTVIEQRYAYEDSSWPTKVTAKYQPRYAHRDITYQNRMAERLFYDGQTGELELQYSSNYYCVDLNATHNAKPKAGVFNVEQSGVSQSIGIVPYVRCDVFAVTEFDTYGRPKRGQKSLALHYASHSNNSVKERAWLETELDYYAVNTPQKAALKSAKLIGATSATTRTSVFDWDAVGNLASVVDNDGEETAAQYDALRRVELVSDPKGGQIQYAYDDIGLLRGISRKVDNSNWTVSRAEYYSNRQLKTLTDPDGDITFYEYDGAGRTQYVTDGENRKTKTIYYSNGQVKCTIKGYGSDLAQAYAMYDYAADGQVQSQRPAKGISLVGGNTPTDCDLATTDYDTNLIYDEYRRLFETTFPKRAQDSGTDYAHTDGPWVGRTYTRQWLDASGNIYQTRTRSGELISQLTDVGGNVYRRNTPDASYYFVNYGQGHQYYADIRPRDYSVSDTGSQADKYPIEHRQYNYIMLDDIGQTLFERHREGYGALLSPKYPETRPYFDTVGNLNAIGYYGGAKAFYDYDALGQMETAHFSANGSTASQKLVSTTEYDLMGRMKSNYKGDHTQNGNGAYSRQQYHFDADSDLKEIEHQYVVHSGAQAGFSHKYDQDKSGKIKKAFSTNPTFRTLPPVRYEDYGSSNNLDQYENVNLGDGAGIQAFTYDANGNLTSDGMGRSYSYNSENQLIRAIGTGGDAFDMEYRYDPLGRRSHSIDHTPSGIEIFHKYFGQMEVEDMRIIREGGVKGEGKVIDYMPLFRNILGGGVDERLAYHDVDGDELTIPLTNHQGSIIMMTDETGHLLSHSDGGRYVYDAFGRNINDAPETGYPYRYAGRRFDVQTGLYYYRARYYDPRIGKFLQTDPIGTDDQMNLYAYVGNDPVNLVDPSGMESLVASGSDETHNIADHFAENAVARAKKMKETDPNTTWLVKNTGGDKYMQSLGGHIAAAEASGINVVQVGSVREMKNYINNKSVYDASNARSLDPITNFSYVGHGEPGHLSPEYGSGSNTISAGDLSAGAFSSDALLNFAATCNSSTGGNTSFTSQLAGSLSGQQTLIGRVGLADFYTSGVDSDQDLGNPKRVPFWSSYRKKHSTSHMVTTKAGQ